MQHDSACPWCHSNRFQIQILCLKVYWRSDTRPGTGRNTCAYDHRGSYTLIEPVSDHRSRRRHTLPKEPNDTQLVDDRAKRACILCLRSTRKSDRIAVFAFLRCQCHKPIFRPSHRFRPEFASRTRGHTSKYGSSCWRACRGSALRIFEALLQSDGTKSLNEGISGSSKTDLKKAAAFSGHH